MKTIRCQLLCIIFTAMAPVMLTAQVPNTPLPDAAITEARKAIALNPNDPVAHSNLGLALNAKGEWPGAIAAYRKATDLKPDYAEAYTNLGNALRNNRDSAGAIAAHHKAIELRPGFAEAYYNLGVALHATGQIDAAISAFRKAIELKPDFVGAHNNLGSSLSAIGDLGGAIAAYGKAIELRPDIAELHNNLGVAFTSSGQFSQAIASFERAQAIDRNAPQPQPSAQNVAATRNLIQQEAALVGKLKSGLFSRKPPVRIEYETALDDIYRRLQPPPPPGERRLREYAGSHREKLGGALDRAVIQMITIPKGGTEGATDPAPKRQWAAEVRRKAAGGTDFGELASSYSADSFASKRGRREITRVSLKKLLSDAAFALKPGQLSPVLEDEGTLYLIRMVERQAADPKAINLDDPEVRSAVAAMIEAERREAWKERFWRQCVEKAGGK